MLIGLGVLERLVLVQALPNKEKQKPLRHFSRRRLQGFHFFKNSEIMCAVSMDAVIHTSEMKGPQLLELHSSTSRGTLQLSHHKGNIPNSQDQKMPLKHLEINSVSRVYSIVSRSSSGRGSLQYETLLYSGHCKAHELPSE